MPLITITRLDFPPASIQFGANHSHDVLLTMERTGCSKGDIYRDGHYLMTAWKDDNDVWALYCRQNAQRVLPNGQGLRVVND
jgi:hypothetical protein